MLLATISTIFITSAKPPQEPIELLDPKTIPKYTNQLTGPPPVYVPHVTKKGGEISYEYTVLMQSFDQQILPTKNADGTPTGYGKTPVWGYGGIAKDAITGKNLGFVHNSPGPSFEAVKGIPTQVRWINVISDEHMFAVDPTLHWANPNNVNWTNIDPIPFPPGYPEAQSPVPLIPHLHGAEVQSIYDGHPDAWFTIDGKQGPAYNTASNAKGGNSALFIYPNEQDATTLWYHDHALGVTRINVMSGLAGFYLLRDETDTTAEALPSGKYEMPLVIQDRVFNEDGTMWFPTEGNSPEDHPYWNPEFFGDTIMINGLVWPNMNVDQGQYRLRLLDGSNARFYTFQFLEVTDGETDPPTYGDAVPFTVIGSDGGYIYEPVEDITELTIGPGERIDILIDFTDLDEGDKVIMTNTAAAPYKGPETIIDEDLPDPSTTGQLMQFTVTAEEGFEEQELPTPLNPTLPEYPTLGAPDDERTLPFFEAMSAEDEPIGVFLNGQKWSAEVTETPIVGSTEDWYLVNPTEDVHPIHTHLVQFQILYRQPIDVDEYLDAWYEANGEVVPLPDGQDPVEVLVDDFINGPRIDPMGYETGWKDTIHALPGYVTVIRMRFAPQNAPTEGPDAPEVGENLFPFDPTVGPGYVWHCHILDHEDNEMMRPYEVYNLGEP
ncbi:MAG: multicopper oxidase [Candidatus Bathyarchaeota archaeon]